jgi:hypothetical protein
LQKKDIGKRGLLESSKLKKMDEYGNQEEEEGPK